MIPAITDNSTIVLRLTTALVLGALLGSERGVAGKWAGLRTYALVSMASTLFTMISIIISEQYIGINLHFDPMRIVSQILVGIGFIGAGVIIFKENKLLGLTTAASLWVSAGIGIAIGYGLYILAITSTILTLFTLIALLKLENYIKDRGRYSKNL